MSRVEQTHGQLAGGQHRGGLSAAPVLDVMGVRDERADRFLDLSAQAYQGALQWAAVGAHPAGARQQGFGAWSAAPEGTRR